MDRVRAVDPQPAAIACGCEPPPKTADWLRVGLGLVISGQLMILSLAMNLSAVDPTHHERLSVALLGLTTLGVGLLGPDLARATARAWRRGDISLEAMFGLAGLGGLGASLWGLYTGGDVFFEVVTVVLAVHAVGAKLKGRFWSAALARVGASTWVTDGAVAVRGDRLEPVDLDALGPGDLVAVFPGDRVPADGVIAEGSGWIDTQGLDGDLSGRPVDAGDEVPGGALLSRGSLRVQLAARPDEGAHAAALSAWVEAVEREIPATGMARRLARWFAPVVATVALGSGLAWGLADGVGAGFRVATAVLLVACPCGLGVATPVALWATAARLGARGIGVRQIGVLEDLAEARTVLLDKTGTLTEVLPEPEWTVHDAPVPAERLRAWVGAVQAWSNHPVALALRHPHEGIAVRGIGELPGGGLSARVVDEGRAWALEIRPSGAERGVEVRVDGRPAATVALRERLRAGQHPGQTEAQRLIEGLALRGVEVEVLTGDRVGLPGARSQVGLKPADKAARVEALSASRGPVVFVGDAANDLPALARADVAVGVLGACEGVAEQVDLAVEGASDLLVAVDAARAARRRIKALITGSAVGNVVGITVAAAGLLHPVVAALLMAGSSLAVTLLAVPSDGEAAGAPERGRGAGALQAPLAERGGADAA